MDMSNYKTSTEELAMNEAFKKRCARGFVAAALMVGVAHMIFAIWCTSGCPGL